MSSGAGAAAAGQEVPEPGSCHVRCGDQMRAAIRSVLLAAGMEQEGGSTAEPATSATQVE